MDAKKLLKEMRKESKRGRLSISMRQDLIDQFEKVCKAQGVPVSRAFEKMVEMFLESMDEIAKEERRHTSRSRDKEEVGVAAAIQAIK